MQLVQAILPLLALAAVALAQTLTVSDTSVTESFDTTVTVAVAGGSATPDPVCFVASCPAGYTPSSASGASILNPTAGVSATGQETFIFQSVPTNPTCSTCPSLTITSSTTFNIVAATSLCATASAAGFPQCPEVSLGSATFNLGASYSADLVVCTSACGGDCIASSSLPGTAAVPLTLVTNPPVTSLSTEFCAVSPTASGFPTIDACVNVPGVTFELTASFTGQTPVCTSILAVPTFTFGSETTVIPAASTDFATQLTGTVGSDGTALPLLPSSTACFTAASPTCPVGYTTAGLPGGASFVGTTADVTATATEALVFATAPAASCCPNQAIVPLFGNLGPTTATLLCATPSATGFTSCAQLTYSSATFNLGATYTADAITCTSTTSVFTSTLTGTAGSSIYSASVVTSTATDGNSASVTPAFCLTASPTPLGVCPVGYTTSGLIGVAAFTDSTLAVTATGTGTTTTATSDTCTLSATAYATSV
ncbi:hypothetical protein V1520DRAFT_342771 [Lipomyces starkeyi]